MLSPHDATFHQETGDHVDLGGSFNTAYRDTVSCFMVHCCIVWIDLNKNRWQITKEYKDIKQG